MNSKADNSSLRIYTYSERPGLEGQKWSSRENLPEFLYYVVPGALAPVSIDREGNIGTHEEPGVWFVHEALG